MAIAAQIATLPIVVGTFQRISLVSLPANVLAAPTIPPLMTLGVGLAALGFLPGFDVAFAWGAWLLASALLGIIHGAASLPGGMVAVGKAPAWLPWLWYGALGCWVTAGSADVRALGVRPSLLRSLALASPLVLVGWLGLGWIGAGRSTTIEIALLDVDPAAAFIRTPSGRTVLVTAGAPGPGLLASVGGQLDLSESAVDVVIGPDGLRTGVDLLALAPDATSEREPVEVAARELGPGARIELGDGVTIQVVDTRTAGQVSVLDLAILANDLAVLLPGPGEPSTFWAELAPDSVSVARLPSSAIAWARALPPRNWLLLIGEPSQERARGESGVPLVTRRAHGQIELSLDGDALAVVAERCADGAACQIALPAPTLTSLSRQP
jgi:hypothetical protein